MNYEMLNYIDNGIIIEDMNIGTIVYMNEVAKKLLKISQEDENKIKTIRQLISNDETFEKMKLHIQSDIRAYKKSEGMVYLKTLEDTFIEVNFCSTWFSKEERLVSHIFQKAIEVMDESEMSFKELAEHLPSGIIVMDIEHELSITYANMEHYKILGIEEVHDTIEQTYLLKDFIFEEDLHWVLSEIYMNLAKNEDVDIEFRMKTQENVVKWVRLFGRAHETNQKKKLFYSSLKDLSQRRSIQDKLHMERVLFHKIAELTDEVLFRLDLQTNIIHFLGKPSDIFEEITVFENYPESILKLYKLHKDDFGQHEELIRCFQNGIEKPIELRYKLGKDIFEWHRISYNFIKNSDGEPISVIGKMANIHQQKILEEQAKRDLLTNFYNKVTTEIETNHLLQLKSEVSHAFFIIDIDNFKAINDNLGHHFGDNVLKELAKDIKNCFRKNDIFGRIGGDEFVVVMREMGDRLLLKQKAELLCQTLKKTFLENGREYTISASIGISIYPEDGIIYEELYKKSDVALYDVKENGKNGYKQFFEKEEINPENTINVSRNREQQDTKEALFFHHKLMSTVYGLLYRTQDKKEDKINAMIQIIGEMFQVEHCFLLKEGLKEGEEYYEVSYEWNKQDKSDTYKRRFIKKQDIKELFQEEEEEDVYQTNEIQSIHNETLKAMWNRENIQSICMIQFLKQSNKGEENFMILLEVCEEKRVFTMGEKFTLHHITKFISEYFEA